MADRTSARVFGDVFKILAKQPDVYKKSIAEEIWQLTDAYDFHPYQMGCKEELRTLGLIKVVTAKQLRDSGFSEDDIEGFFDDTPNDKETLDVYCTPHDFHKLWNKV